MWFNVRDHDLIGVITNNIRKSLSDKVDSLEIELDKTEDLDNAVDVTVRVTMGGARLRFRFAYQGKSGITKTSGVWTTEQMIGEIEAAIEGVLKGILGSQPVLVHAERIERESEQQIAPTTSQEAQEGHEKG